MAALTVKHHGSNNDENPGDFSDYEPLPDFKPKFKNPTEDGEVTEDTVRTKEDLSPHHNDGTEYLRTRKVGNGPGQPPTVTNVQWLDADHNVQKELSGLSVAADVFLDGVTQSSRSDRYDFWTSLLVGKITVTGSSGDDPFMEVGQGGNAKVSSGGGDDTLYLWHTKNVVYDGGAGSDTLMLEHFDGGGAGSPSTGINVNLATGAVTANPFGGTLKLIGVENVTGTFLNDVLKGNNAANKFDADAGGSDGGVDKIFGAGGNDTIIMAGSRDGLAHANVANGGTGVDLLRMFIDGPVVTNTLDLGNQANNTGVFRGGSFTNFETFEFFTSFGFENRKLVFRGSSANEKVLSGSGDDTLLGGGGNDSFDGSNGKDRIDGGAGADTWDRSRLFGDVIVALKGAAIVSVKVNGVVEDRINNIENLSTGFGDDRLTGDGKANQLSGGEGDDILVGGAGNDVLIGGTGKDTMTGGVGKDAFVFDTALNQFVSDQISGFSVADDTIRLDNAIFIGIGGNGALAAGKFHIGANATAPGQRILYDPATGALIYDSDGSVGDPTSTKRNSPRSPKIST